MFTNQAVFNSWNWEAMSVASTILLRSDITHCLIGSAGLQLHGICDNDCIRGNTPWIFANTFEVCLRGGDMAKAQEALGEQGLFVAEDTSASGEYDTMYEGTRPLVKLRATFTSSRAIHPILLPREDYFNVDGKICYVHVPDPRSVRGGNTSKPGGQLPVVTSMSTMLLSLLHRVFAHQDHTVERCLARMLLSQACAVRPPTHWSEAVQAEARKWLADRHLLGSESDDVEVSSPPGPHYPMWLLLNHAIAERPFWLDEKRDEKENPEMQGDAHDDEQLATS